MHHRIQRRCVIIKEHGGILAELIHILQHLSSGSVAVVNLQCHGLHDDLLQTAGDIGIQNRGHHRTAVDVLNGNRHRGITVIGRSACHHLIHHDTQRIDIGTGIHPATLGLLGADVVYAAQCFLGEGIALGHHPGDTKVRNLDAAILQHHHIMGFDIPVNNATAVGMLQGFGDLNTKMKGLLPVQSTSGLHVLLQADAFDQLHNDIVRHNGGGNIVDRDDIGMAQHSNRLALRMEAAAEILIPQVIIL